MNFEFEIYNIATAFFVSGIRTSLKHLLLHFCNIIAAAAVKTSELLCMSSGTSEEKQADEGLQGVTSDSRRSFASW